MDTQRHDPPATGEPAEAAPQELDEPTPDRPLNRPVRALVAAAEVVVAVGFVLVAVWAWGRSSIPVVLPDYENPAIPPSTTRQSGPWAAAAVGAGLAAGLLLLDALRQTLLAVRTTHTEPPPLPDDPAFAGDQQTLAVRADDAHEADDAHVTHVDDRAAEAPGGAADDTVR